VIFRRTKSLVRLDIGSSAAKAVELRRVSSGYRVVAMGSEPLPPDLFVDGAIIDGGVVSDVIRQLFDRNGIKTKELELRRRLDGGWCDRVPRVRRRGVLPGKFDGDRRSRGGRNVDPKRDRGDQPAHRALCVLAEHAVRRRPGVL
jgi:hypothetical protein